MQLSHVLCEMMITMEWSAPPNNTRRMCKEFALRSTYVLYYTIDIDMRIYGLGTVISNSRLSGIQAIQIKAYGW